MKLILVKTNCLKQTHLRLARGPEKSEAHISLLGKKEKQE